MTTHPDYEEARSLMEAGRYSDALALLKSIESSNGHRADIEFGKGVCLAAMGRITEARMAVRHLQNQGRTAMAQRLAERLSEEDPSRLEPSEADYSHPKQDRTYRNVAILGAVLSLLVAGIFGLVHTRSQSGAVVLKEAPTLSKQSSPPGNGSRETNAAPAKSGANRTPTSAPAAEAPASLDLAGVWQSVDFVRDMADFKPGVRAWQGELFLRDFVCTADGGTSQGWTWRAGWITHSNGTTRAPYYVKTLRGSTFLFLPWLSGDVTVHGQKPMYYVLRKTNGANSASMRTQEPRSTAQNPLIEQDGSLDLTGTWRSVDFVRQVQQFRPTSKFWQEDFFLKDLDCTFDGDTSLGWTWGDGWVLHSDGRTQARYFVKVINGQSYLFLPWLSGDVTIRGQAPSYYVMVRTS